MATVNITCRINYNQENNITSVSFLPNNSFESPLTVIKGDTVQFTVQQTGSATGYNFVIYGFDPGYWTDTTNGPMLPPGGVFSRTTDASASVGSGHVDQLTMDAYGSPSRFTAFFIRIIDNLDTTPDPFDVGSNVSGVAPSDRIAGVPFTLSGLTANTSATCSAGCDFTVNNGLSTTSATVKNGDRLQLFVTAPSAWNASNTGTLTVGGVSDSMIVTTVSQPSLNQLIPFPRTSLPVRLTEVINFFGGTFLAFPPPRNLRSYFKNGAYVPDISANWRIPTSGNLALSAFLSSATALIFTSYPRAQNTSGDTRGGTTTLSLTWGAGVGGSMGFDIGYGPGMKGAVEYRYLLQENSGGLLSTGLNLSSNTGSPMSWSANNTYVTLSQTHNNLERRYSGRLIIEVRSTFNNSVIASASVNYSLNFYGP